MCDRLEVRGLAWACVVCWFAVSCVSEFISFLLLITSHPFCHRVAREWSRQDFSHTNLDTCSVRVFATAAVSVTCCKDRTPANLKATVSTTRCPVACRPVVGPVVEVLKSLDHVQFLQQQFPEGVQHD